MRRVVLGLAGAAVAVGACFGALALRTPPGAIESELISALGAGSGLTATVRGPTRFALFPTPNVRLEDVTLSDASGAPLATVRALIATPRLKALALGAVEIDEITLKSPTLPADALDLEPFVARLAALGDPGARPPALRIVDGAVTWAGGRLDGIEAGVAWPRVGRALSLTGAARFRGRDVEFRASVDDPASFARGERSAVKARLEGGDARIVFEGIATARGDARRLDGALGLRAASLKDAAAWFGAAVPALGAPLAGVTLSGRAGIDRHGVAVEGAELAIDGAEFVGSARFGLKDGRADVEATLDARSLDVTRYLDDVQPALGDDGGWSAAPLDVRPFDALDLDLRLSAGSVTAGRLRFGPTAATVTVADGALDVAVGEAAAYGGALSGHIGVEPDGRRTRLRLEVRALGIDLGEALEDAGLEAALSGALAGDASLDGHGATAAEIVRDLSGRASAKLEGGTLSGFRAKALALIGLGGRLDVRSAEGTVSIARGVARTEDLLLAGPNAELRLTGDADLAERRLALAGALAALDGAFRAPVRVEGPFADPKLRLGARAPDRRSDARSPETPRAAAR